MIERDGEPLSVGRKTRTVPAATRRALRSRDRGCRFPGCEHRRFVDAHHIEHWARGGETALENLVELCRHHHRLVHEGDFTIERRDGQIVFRRADGRSVEQVPAALTDFDPRTLPAPLARRGSLQPASGERFDLDLTVRGLADLAEHRGLVSTLGP